MNSLQILYEQYGILSDLDTTGRVRFICSRNLSDGADCCEIGQLIADVAQNKRRLSKDDKIIVNGDRQMLVLYPGEIRRLLTNDPDLYVTALKRGKAEKRTQSTERRR